MEIKTLKRGFQALGLLLQKAGLYRFFIILLILLTLYFNGAFLLKLKTYIALSSQVKPEKVAWEITEDKKGRLFGLIMRAQYQHEGQDYFLQEKVGDLKFPHPAAAEAYAKEVGVGNIWFCAQDPQRATFLKNFPAKEAFNGVVMIGLTIYFFYLPRRHRRLIHGSR